jgi:myo-inositol-hexaphosphate 3-phosphohydrolase
MVWSAGRNEGNPTRSVENHNLIKRVKKKEVRKQGVASHTQRAITELEFCTLYTIFRDVSISMLWRYGMSAMINFQSHVIARIDDTTLALTVHIRVHDLFPNCLKTKLNWSKNGKLL